MGYFLNLTPILRKHNSREPEPSIGWFKTPIILKIKIQYYSLNIQKNQLSGLDNYYLKLTPHILLAIRILFMCTHVHASDETPISVNQNKSVLSTPDILGRSFSLAVDMYSEQNDKGIYHSSS